MKNSWKKIQFFNLKITSLSITTGVHFALSLLCLYIKTSKKVRLEKRRKNTYWARFLTTFFSSPGPPIPQPFSIINSVLTVVSLAAYGSFFRCFISWKWGFLLFGRKLFNFEWILAIHKFAGQYTFFAVCVCVLRESEIVIHDSPSLISQKTPLSSSSRSTEA